MATPRLMGIVWAVGALLLVGGSARNVAAQCVGDCNQDGEVTWRELVLVGDRAVGKFRNCPSADANGDGQVHVEEVVRAARNLREGCVPPPTRTLTPTPTMARTATPTRTRTPVSVGPVVTFFGVVRADGTVIEPGETAPDGAPIYTRPFGAGFLLVVEARPGSSNSPVRNRTTPDGDPRPDLQIQSDRDLGNGSGLVCDVGPISEGLPLGGVPGISPPSFDSESQAITDALVDFGCRFGDATNQWCTFDAGENANPVTEGSPGDLVQFCTQEVIGRALQFPSGETRLTVRVRDFADNLGAPASLIVRAP